MNHRIETALELATDLATRPWQPPAGRPRPRPRRFVVGDPQAPAVTFLSILEGHQLLGDDGRLAADVGLLSVGDHFDYGATAERAEATENGLQILSWLAAHPGDQVTILAGNHDLGRVGELAAFDDPTFAALHAEAAAAYQSADVAAEAALIARHPAIPTAELAARDFAAFSSRQRELVSALLHGRRLRVAAALSERVLACHAGVTTNTLAAIGVDSTDWGNAIAVADKLNERLDAAVSSWTRGRLDIDGMHQSGRADRGEGVGMFYHRPANPALEVNRGYSMTDAMSRRYDPRRLPPELTQVVGHISDKKCRSLLGDWARGPAAAPGELRHLRTDGTAVAYQAGLPRPLESASMIFVDSGMSRIPSEAYKLLDVSALAAPPPA